MIKAAEYQDRFAKHIALFSQRRSELQMILSAYAASKIEEVSNAISKLEDKLNNLNEKLDSITSMLKEFTTHQETDILQFIEENGGTSTCISNDTLFFQLLAKSGERVPTAEATRGDKEKFETLRKELRSEISKNLFEVLDTKFSQFYAILNMHFSDSTAAELEAPVSTIWLYLGDAPDYSYLGMAKSLGKNGDSSEP